MAKAKPAARRPAKSAAPDGDETAPITVAWSLAELPSAQHRAGLAGLAMLVPYTRSFDDLPDGAILELARLDDVGLELRVNRAGLTALFDKVYQTSVIEINVENPWKGIAVKEVLASETVEGNKKAIKKRYLHDIDVPRGGPLGELSPKDDNGLWIKLWRDWLYKIVRLQPATKFPYEYRAGKRKNATPEVSDAWKMLRMNKVQSLANHWYLGAMEFNSESVPFQNSGQQFFLLHFWPFATHIFIEQGLKLEKNILQHSEAGFVTCIPDVMRLATFVRAHERTLRTRTADAARFLGYRPKAAIIDLADASALEADRWLDQALEQSLANDTRRVVAGFQVVHAVKEGNSVRIRSNRIISPTPSAKNLSAFVQEKLWSHLVRRQVLATVLDHGDRPDPFPWWQGFERMCATWGKELTIHDAAFCHDARLLFSHFSQSQESTMTDPDTPRPARELPTIILHVVQAWVNGRLQAKFQLKWSDVTDGKATRDQFEEKKGKLATEAFLAARSRPGREFARWFTATLCSINQRLSDEEFVLLSTALEQQPEQVRSLTLLALSARG